MTHGQVHTIVITATVDPATAGGTDRQYGQRRDLDRGPGPGQQRLDTSDYGQVRRHARPDQDVRFGDATAGGSSQTVTIIVTNTGALSTAHDVRVADTLDPRLVVTGVDCSAFDTDASSGQTVDCTIGLLPAGDSATITVTYRVDTATEAAPVVSNTADAETADNGGQTASDSDDVAIAENVVLDQTKTFDSATATAGGASQTFTITVKNTGVSQADHVNVSDSVDTRLAASAVTTARSAAPRPPDHRLRPAPPRRRGDRDHRRHLQRRHRHRGRPVGLQHRLGNPLGNSSRGSGR